MVLPVFQIPKNFHNSIQDRFQYLVGDLSQQDLEVVCVTCWSIQNDRNHICNSRQEVGGDTPGATQPNSGVPRLLDIFSLWAFLRFFMILSCEEIEVFVRTLETASTASLLLCSLALMALSNMFFRRTRLAQKQMIIRGWTAIMTRASFHDIISPIVKAMVIAEMVCRTSVILSPTNDCTCPNKNLS